MVTRITHAEAARIAAAVEAAETRTGAELVCVMARATSTYAFFPLVWATLVALVVPAALLQLTRWSAEVVYLLQLAAFGGTLALLSWRPLRMRLVPRALQRRRAHRAAAEQFVLRGLANTPGRTGVLVFVAEAERYARVIADDGVTSRVDPARWREVVGLLTDHARDGRLADGYCAAVERCGDILAAHLPPEAPAANHLPNHFFVI